MKIEALGSKAIRTDTEGYNSLIDFYERCSKYKNEQITIDFSELTWVDANLASLIIAILKKLEVENGLSFFADENVIRSKFSFFITNGLVGWEKLVRNMGVSHVMLTGFTCTEDEKFMEYISKELLDHPTLSIAEKDRVQLVDSFLEIFVNVQKHARTDSLFACGQYYQLRDTLSFTLVDLGVGYLLPITEYTHGEIKTAADAIDWAIKGNSTKKDAPGGLGLQEIQRFCDNNGAKFEIITGGAYWNNYLLFPVEVKPFCGTIVNILFNCRNLRERNLG